MNRFAMSGMAKTLIVIFVLIISAHCVAVTSPYIGISAFLSWEQYLDLDKEFNVPSVYSGLLWGIASFLCLNLALQRKELIERLFWSAFSALFFFICFDEQMVLHEKLAIEIRKFFAIADGSILYHAWIIPALLLTVGFIGLYYVSRRYKSLSSNAKTIMKYVIIAGLGVVILEAIGTLLYFDDLAYKLGPVLFEESFEIIMASLIVCKLTYTAIPRK